MPFSIIRDDITKVKVDAIVDTADHEGITPAFGIGARFIIHSSGPYWEGGDSGEEALLRQCYDRALLLAYENGCESIAFPLLATGTYGFPQELGIRIAIDAFTVFLEDHEMEITLVVFGEYAYHVSGRLFDDVKSFIDDEYVRTALEDEYADDGVPIEAIMNLESAEAFCGACEEAEICDKDEGFLAEEDWDEECAHEAEALPPDMVMMQAGAAFSKAEVSLDDALREMYTDSFEKHLQQLINKKGLKNSEIYTAANISKQYFSKLLKGQVKPSKEKVLALAVGLRLNLDETVDFLRLAGYALSPISQTDVVVKYFIVHELYSVIKIDMTLFDYGLDPLSKG